jgi:membrane protein DedA with SNARE-associated domain
LEDLIARFGLLAIFVGAALEGEPFALAGGVFAQRGWISLFAAAPTAAAGAICIDQFWFHLSRNFRESRLIQRAVRRPAFRRALGLVARYPVWFIILFRFAYGLRACGALSIPELDIP